MVGQELPSQWQIHFPGEGLENSVIAWKGHGMNSGWVVGESTVFMIHRKNSGHALLPVRSHISTQSFYFRVSESLSGLMKRKLQEVHQVK